jgi:hypothetical protein
MTSIDMFYFNLRHLLMCFATTSCGATFAISYEIDRRRIGKEPTIDPSPDPLSFFLHPRYGSGLLSCKSNPHLIKFNLIHGSREPRILCLYLLGLD